MLGNLMKYEIQATRRIFLPLYGLILVFTCINKIFIVANYQKLSGLAAMPFWITMMVYVLLIAALFIMTLVVLIQRFQKNLLGDEGYLSFTLPVRTHTHLDAKMIVTVMWTVLSLLVAVLSVFLLAVDSNVMQAIGEGWAGFLREIAPYGASFYGILAEGIVLVLLVIAKETLHIYFSIAVGNFSSKHKLLAAFGVFVGVSVVEQIVVSLIVNADVQTQALVGSGFTVATAAAVLGFLIAYTLVFGGLYYFLTEWILGKKLNLE